MKIAAAILSLMFSTLCAADPVGIQNLRMWTAPDNTRLVFDLSAPTSYKVFALTNPRRLVVDLQGAIALKPFPQPPAADPLVARIRTATRNGTDVRVVLDLKQAVDPKTFMLKPNAHYGHRLVLDLHNPTASARRAEARREATKKVKPGQLRDIVIAIDAGHGGEDPGAKGFRGTWEKHVVLKVARELARELKQVKGIRPVLIRDGDYYVGLRKRMDIARREKADLFVSIHADAFRQSQVHGSSVYVLSSSGASSEAARWLAEKENASDLVGGVKLDDKDDLLASVLLDLSQTASLEASNAVAARVLTGLRGLGKVHKKTVQHAAFAVLKSPDVPSILIETAFISNPGDEKRLRNASHRKKMASAISRGIVEYFKEIAPSGTILAHHQQAIARHTVTRGETLSGVAQRYRVSLRDLRSANRLTRDMVKIGQVLKIPRTDIES